MQFVKTELDGLCVIEPKVFSDSRGYFSETYKKADFEKHIGKVDWIQDNESKSTKGVLRGLHFQKGDFAQAKLVRVVVGCVYDVAVDVRKESPTYGRYFGIELSDSNKRQLYIPRGFAHGFLVLSDECIFQYKVDNTYSKENEAGFHYLSFGVKWPAVDVDIVVSEKDALLEMMEGHI